MKRRTSSVLPAFYSQVRRAATAAKQNPRPAWNDSEARVTPPAPNLSKWAAPPPPKPQFTLDRSNNTPRNQSTATPPKYQVASDRPTRNHWLRPQNAGTSSSNGGKWSQPENARTPPHSDRAGGSAASRQSPIGRWGRQDAPHQQPASQGSQLGGNRNPRLQRDELPHRAGALPNQSRVGQNRARGDSRWDTRDTKGTGSREGPSRQWEKERIPTSKATKSAELSKPGDAYSEADLEDVQYSENNVSEGSRLDRVPKFGRDKASFKKRGSISGAFQGEEVAIPGQSRVNAKFNAAQKDREKKRSFKTVKKVNPDVFIPSTVSVGQLSRLLNVRMKRLQRKMVEQGMSDESEYDYVLTSEYAGLLAEEFGRNPVINDEAAFDIYPRPPHPDPSTLPLRPPIVTIMGHVDHGKTTLLDTLRSASVAKGEAGGITQHIGAFSVPVPGSADGDGPKTITFLDTPGHAAFSAMRARGAGVTDIIVLVVAADDGVMPQTKEVIELTKKDEGKVGVVVAINKVDKDGVNVDHVTQALMVEGIQLESYGGDTPGVEVSGLTGHGLDNLVETLSAMAEMQDLRAERDGQVHGYVIESKVHKGLGPVATVLILRGCLTTSSHLISGTSHGKVRLMHDSAGVALREAYPGMAVTVSGWKQLPSAGEEVLSGSEADIKKAWANRQRKAEIEASLVDLEAINSQRIEERRKEGEEGDEQAGDTPSGPKELRLVIKGDVSGSVEAVIGAVQDIGNKEAIVKIVSSGVGDVSESDVMMAKAADGMVVAFSVNTPRSVERIAASNVVPLYSSTIIYRVMEEVRKRVTGLLPVIVEKKVVGEAEVLQLFDISIKSRKTMQVGGCRVTNGVVEKSSKGRVMRDGNILHEGPLDTLRQAKKDATEVRKGSECGLSFTHFKDLKEGDFIQMYHEVEKPGVL